MSGLVDDLGREADALVERTVTQMYEHPFWIERFGERGEKYSREDGRFHVTYLAQAMRENAPGILTGYARWLQGVLTRRGMCSRHLWQHFERLRKALAETPRDGLATADDFLVRAQQALSYDAPIPREIEQAWEPIAAELRSRLGEQVTSLGPDARRVLLDDLPIALSYLTDAVSIGSSKGWTDYHAWLAGHLERRGVPAEVLASWDRALQASLETVLSPGVAAAVGAVLRGS